MSSRFKLWPVYILGTCFVGEGILAFIYPSRAYTLFGVAPPQLNKPTASASPDVIHPAVIGTASRPDADANADAEAPSPFMLAKSARDIAFGLTFWVLQAGHSPRSRRLSPAVTAFGAVVAITGALDGCVVWRYGGKDNDQRKKKAISHWIGSAAIAFWVFLRATRNRDMLLSL